MEPMNIGNNQPSLTKLNPLSSITLPNNLEIDPIGLILVVGPNSSGKTQLLKDIHSSILGETRTPVVASKVVINKPESVDELLTTLEKEGYVRQKLNEGGRKIVEVKTVGIGGSAPSLNNTLEMSNVNSWFNNFKEGEVNQHSREFFQNFGTMLITSLFLGNRMSGANQVSGFDYMKTPPTNDLQALYVNSEAAVGLENAVRETFGRGIWIDHTRGNTLSFRITENSQLPPAEDRLRPDKISNIRTIDKEGDGIRSFVAICMALMLSRRPVCLIDEPELCLHPPQAYSLGKIIGEQSKRSVTTIVSTHSSHILRGVIQDGQPVKIIRLTRSAEKFQSHLVEAELLRAVMQKPLIKAEAVFDGLFADGVVLVESEGDRAVYQSVWEVISKPKQLDLLFVSTNGKGAMADIAKFFKTLRIPVAIIADLDLVPEVSVVGKLLSALGLEGFESSPLLGLCQEIAEMIQKIPPSISPVEVFDKLSDIRRLPADWSKGDDVEFVKHLRQLANRIDRMRKLKSGGIPFYQEHYEAVSKKLECVKDSLASHGIFVVPVGELENWFDEKSPDAPSRERKQEFAEFISKSIRMKTENITPLGEFIQCVSGFVSRLELTI